jgi:hypothetical protein
LATGLYRLLELREKLDPSASRQAKHARYRQMDVVTYLTNSLESLIDSRAWQRVGRRISTGFVESSINRVVGRRMCESQHMRWSRTGAHSVVQVRVALLNQELDALARRQFPWIGQRRVSWPWRQTSPSRWRARAQLASCRRMSLSMARGDWPSALTWAEILHDS